MAARSGASGSTTSMKSPAPMPGSPITRMMRPSRGDEHAERVPDQAQAQAELVPHARRPRAGAEIVGVVDRRGAVGRQHQPALVVALERHGAHLGRAQQLHAQLVGHHAAGPGLGGQRGELGAGQAVGQPGDAEVGDRGHEDQHLRQHDEDDRQQQQLGGQAEPAPLRRRRQRRADRPDPLPQPAGPVPALHRCYRAARARLVLVSIGGQAHPSLASQPTTLRTSGLAAAVA